MVTSKCRTCLAPFVVFSFYMLCPIQHCFFLELLNCVHGSDYRGGLKLCCLCICSSSPGNTSWCIKYNSKVKCRFINHRSLWLLCYSFSIDLRMYFFSAFLAHFLLKERLQRMGIVGCITCIVGSVVIVIHAPQEQTPNSVEEIWTLATQPGLKHSICCFHC